MRSQVIGPASSALQRQVDELRGLPNSRDFQDTRARIRRLVIDGNTRQILAGKDGQGRTMAALATSTLKRRKGNGPPLAPRGMASRVITRFRADWVKDGSDWMLRRSWYGFDSAKGFPIMVAHMTGAVRKLANGRIWRLPKRDPSPISPTTHAEIRREFWGLMDRLTRPKR